MRIAFVVSSFANKGPILVVKDLISKFDPAVIKHVEIFYFDEVFEIPFSVPAQKISFFSTFNFAGFDLVHTHGLRPDMFVFRNRKRIVATCVSTMHNVIFEQYKEIYNPLVAFCIQSLWTSSLKRHDAIVCLTTYMRAYYWKFFSSSKLHVVYNGRDIMPFEAVGSDEVNAIGKLKTDYKILGTACVVGSLKGLHQVINALPEMTDYAFILIGDGPELENLKNLAKKFDVADRCLFLGAREQAYKYYPYFDIFVMSSYTEGVPLALLEAAALKIPAICSNIDVLREIFNSEEVSFFELDNSEAFSRSADEIMAHHVDYSFKIHKRYKSNYTGEVMAQNYQRIYSELLKGRSL